MPEALYNDVSTVCFAVDRMMHLAGFVFEPPAEGRGGKP
jgi:hypothetical protein